MAIPTLPPPSAKAVELGERVKAFLEEHIIPAEPVYHRQLEEGMWAAVPVTDSGSGRREAVLVTDFADIPEDAERVLFWPRAAGGAVPPTTSQ